ncbi:Thioredoxin reductase [Bacillus cereus]|nr:Thioredoxin reductase [Bacillus cereus]
MEEANLLTKFATEFHIVYRPKANEKVIWGLNKTPVEVIADGKVTGLKVKDNETGEEEIIETDDIFVAIDHRPNIEFLNGQVEIDKAGYIVVKPGTTQTNILGVFACGEVQGYKYRQAVTAAGTSCMAALDSERFLENYACMIGVNLYKTGV